MGLKDMLFGSGRAKTKVEKLTKRVVNQYAQSVDRYGAMEDLLKLAGQDDDKADEAYVALLKRFTMNASKSIDDEEEKGWLYNRLSAVGKPLLPALKTFCCESESIAWALRIIEDVANETEEWEILDAVMAVHPPEYERDTGAKEQMLTHLKEIDDPRVGEILARYLEDPDENIRFFCIEALIDNAEKQSLPALIGYLEKSEGESVRLQTRILDGLSDLGWDLSAHAALIKKLVRDEHSFDGTKLSRR